VIAYFHYGDIENALALNEIALKLSDPPPIGSLYLRGRLLIHLEKWSEVPAIFQNILEQIVAQPYQSISYQVECKYWMAEALHAQNQTEQAYHLAASALAQSESWMKGTELENPFESFEEIRARLRKLCERLTGELTPPVSLIKVY